MTVANTLDRMHMADKFQSGLKPGQKTLDAIGGAHKLQSWPHNILTGKSIHP